MGWAMLWLFVALKIPILTLGYIVWWAVHQTDDPVTGVSDDGGSKTRPHPRRRLPRPPRRGPHGDPAPASPPRTRSVLVKAKRVDA